MLISSEIASDWRTIGEHPQLIECTGICVSEPGAWIETKGYRRYLDIVKKKNVWAFFFKFSQGTCPWMAFA